MGNELVRATPIRWIQERGLHELIKYIAKRVHAVYILCTFCVHFGTQKAPLCVGLVCT